MASKPLKVRDRVFHVGQIWARSLPGGTAEILEVQGPDHRDNYEYLVLTGVYFSRKPSERNPQTRKEWWSSTATVLAKPSG